LSNTIFYLFAEFFKCRFSIWDFFDSSVVVYLAERSVNDVLDFIFLKNYKSFNASWFVDYVSAETESMKKKKANNL
jgi:hypothetical protein